MSRSNGFFALSMIIGQKLTKQLSTGIKQCFFMANQRHTKVPEESSDSYRVVRINSKSMSPTAQQV